MKFLQNIKIYGRNFDIDWNSVNFALPSDTKIMVIYCDVNKKSARKSSN